MSLTKNKKLGLLFLIGPPVLLILVIVGVAVTESMGSPLIEFILGLIGVVAYLGLTIGLTIGVPLGIYFLSKKEKDQILASLQQKEKYKMLKDDEIVYLGKWSWGAFFGSIIWALGNKLYLWALGFFVPLFNIYVGYKLAIDGRKMAWEKGWTGFDQFKRRQEILEWIIGLIYLFLFGISIITSIF